MVREAEEFASEDEAQRKHVEALKSLSGFVFGRQGTLSMFF
jgi:endoplasmic reticulum chaperone BiP